MSTKREYPLGHGRVQADETEMAHSTAATSSLSSCQVGKQGPRRISAPPVAKFRWEPWMQSDINKWRAQISRCHLSGRTPEDWCRTRWIPVREFYRWEAALEAPTQGMSEKEARNAVFKFLWRTRIADCEASGMNTSSWCRQNNVSRNSYYSRPGIPGRRRNTAQNRCRAVSRRRLAS